jgi:aspartate aminotransferase
LRPQKTSGPALPSTIASSMPVSRIREIMELAWEDPEVIHLEVGEPDFPTPSHIVDAAHEAARAGHTRYAPNAGLPELREALANKVARRNGYEARPEQVVVTQGGIRALLEPGDEILLPDPAWPNFRMIAHLLGARVLPYPLVAQGDFLPRPEDLERLVTPRTRAILVNSPSNPLGTVLPRELARTLLAFARSRGLWIIADEVYDELTFDDAFVSVGSVADPGDRLVSVYSFSKVYAMTGWRVGYLVAPPDLAELLTGMQEPIVSCVNTPAQLAALAAVTGPQQIVGEMRDAYRERRDELLEILDRGGLGADPRAPSTCGPTSPRPACPRWISHGPSSSASTWPSHPEARSANSVKVTCACPWPPRGRIYSMEPRASSGSFTIRGRRTSESAKYYRTRLTAARAASLTAPTRSSISALFAM